MLVAGILRRCNSDIFSLAKAATLHVQRYWGASHFCDEEEEAPLVGSGADPLTAFKCCIENNRWAISSIGGVDTPRSDQKNWNAP